MQADDRRLADIEFYLGLSELQLGAREAAAAHYRQVGYSRQLALAHSPALGGSLSLARARARARSLIRSRTRALLRRQAVATLKLRRATLQKAALEAQISALADEVDGGGGGGGGDGDGDSAAEVAELSKLVQEIEQRLQELAQAAA